MKSAAKGILLTVLILVCLTVGFLGWCSATGQGLLTGQYLQARSGAHMVIDDRGSPIVMGDRSDGGALFDGLSDGDRVLVLCSGIAESYPAQSGAYFCIRLRAGTPEELPADTLAQLRELNWLN